MTYRLGYTESTLIFFYFLDKYCKNANKQHYREQQYNMLKWLYSTSGFYDKSINMDTASVDAILGSRVYNNYFNMLLNIIKKYKKDVQLNFHKIHDELTQNYMDLFYKFIEKPNKKVLIDNSYLFNFIKNKKIIIINNLGVLMKKQYENGNLKKIYSDFPDVESIDFINIGYTFFNNGPHASILDGVKHMYKLIDDKLLVSDADSFIISSGAYSVLLANYIKQKYKKNVVLVGGKLAVFFGIKTNRGLLHQKKIINDKQDYFISVPDSMKPPKYNLIENGCYW